MSFMKRLTLIILFICLAGKFSGQDILVTAQFDTNKIFIGDQIFFTVKIEKPVATDISFPSFKDTLYKNIEIISGPQTDTIALQDDKNAIILKYLVTSFDSGLNFANLTRSASTNTDLSVLNKPVSGFTDLL